MSIFDRLVLDSQAGGLIASCCQGFQNVNGAAWYCERTSFQEQINGRRNLRV